MFGRFLLLGIEARVFNCFFGSCWTGMRRLGEKIETLLFEEKSEISVGVYLFIKSMNPCPITPKKTPQRI
jgi:hypothetical protein